jgi:probable F420-dependent oxidoreductase
MRRAVSTPPTRCGRPLTLTQDWRASPSGHDDAHHAPKPAAATMKVRFAVAPTARSFDTEELGMFASLSEELGFDTIWLSDVPLGALGDPLLSLAYVSARTMKLRLGANVVPIGRNPMLLARELAQLDQLSGGRLLLAFVPGVDQPGERSALGFPKGDRVAMMVEVIGLLRRWWSGERVELQEGGFDFRGIRVHPTPVQSPLEIWMGGAGPKTLERVGQVADGWLTANITPDEAARGREAIQAAATRHGREIDAEHFGISMPYARSTVSDSTLAVLRARRPNDAPDLEEIVPVGPDALVSLLKRHIDAGLSKFVLRPSDPTSLEDDLAWLADVVLPLPS